MARSLKAYIPALAEVVGLTPAALYERQRALVRAGILGVQEGHGPGSGVQLASAGAAQYAVALLLIAILATDNLSETADRVANVAKAAPQALGKASPLTGRSCFVDAFAELLTVPSRKTKVRSVSVNRTEMTATICYTRADGKAASLTFGGGRNPSPGAAISIEATLNQNAITTIAARLYQMFDAEQRKMTRAKA